MSIPSRSALSDITYAAGNVTNRPATKAYQPMAPSSTGLPYMGASTGAPEVLSMPPSSLSMSAKKEPAIHVPSYAKRIINMMYMTERSTAIVQSHLSVCQVEVTDKMRAILVDWLVDVHLKYKCRPETLYLAINLLDRFLMRMVSKLYYYFGRYVKMATDKCPKLVVVLKTVHRKSRRK
ncbi:S-phase entry cyclin-6 [Diplonema papillatum]|nr:S-phase entry cyclin-6 [Diplonema papillatum]